MILSHSENGAGSSSSVKQSAQPTIDRGPSWARESALLAIVLLAIATLVSGQTEKNEIDLETIGFLHQRDQTDEPLALGASQRVEEIALAACITKDGLIVSFAPRLKDTKIGTRVPISYPSSSGTGKQLNAVFLRHKEGLVLLKAPPRIGSGPPPGKRFSAPG